MGADREADRSACAATGRRAYGLGPEAGEWLQQATLAVRAHVPVEVLRDTVQPFPSFSEIYNTALKVVRLDIDTAHTA